MQIVDSPLPQFFETDGSPLDDGYVYVGTAGLNPETSPAPVFWDPDGLLPAAQPLRTNNGFIARTGTPSFVFCSDPNYSITVRDRRGNLVFSSPSVVPGGSGTVAFVSALYFVGDTDTGITNPAPGTLAVQTDGVQRMQVDSAGRVGINGAPVGAARLTVHDASGNRQIRAIHSTGTGLAIGQDSASGPASIINQDNASLVFGTNNVARMTISGAGNWTLSTDVAAALSAAVWNPNAGASANAACYVQSDAGMLRMRISSIAGGGNSAIVSDTPGALSIYTTGAYQLRLGTNGNDNRLAITSAGDVDIVKGSGSLRVGGAITRSERTGSTIGSSTFSETIAHGGPRVPDVMSVVLQCISPDAGYALNDEVPITLGTDTLGVWNTFQSATQVGLRIAAGWPVIIHKSSGVVAYISSGAWRAMYRCIWL